MNSALKSFLWLAVAAGLVWFGLWLRASREMDGLLKEYDGLALRSSNLVKDISLAKAKMEIALTESGAGDNMEQQHIGNQTRIAEEQKKIEALTAKWATVESDRAAAVQAVREKEPTRPVTDLTLTDGTAMPGFSIRSIPSEEQVSAEYTSGLVKVPADKLPENIRTRLGFGWKPEPPPAVSFDKEGNAVVKQAVNATAERESVAEASTQLGLGKTSEIPGSMADITKAIAINDARLSKALVTYENQRQTIRHLGIFKPNVRANDGRPYGTHLKEANSKLSALAGQVQALRAEKSNLQYRLKSL